MCQAAQQALGSTVKKAYTACMSQTLCVSKLREISEACLIIPILQINYPTRKEFKQTSMEKEVCLAELKLEKMSIRLPFDLKVRLSLMMSMGTFS